MFASAATRVEVLEPIVHHVETAWETMAPVMLMATVLVVTYVSVRHCSSLVSLLTRITAPRKSVRRKGGIAGLVTPLLMLTLAVSPVAATVAASTDPSEKCNLRCWLKHLTIEIPDIHTVEAGFEIDINELTCHGVDFGSIESHFSEPASIDFKLLGVGTNCTAKWGYREVAWPHLHGQGTVKVTVADTSAALGLELEKLPNGLAGSAKETGCDIKVVIKDMHFTGGATGAVLELLRKAISNLILHQGNKIGCREVSSLIDVNLTSVLKDMNQMIEPFLHPDQHPVMPDPVPPGSLPLDTNKVVDLLDFVLNELAGANGVLGINKIVELMTGNTGAVRLSNLDKYHQSFEMNDLANLTVGLSEVNISGLDSWNVVKVMVPVSEFVLSSLTGQAEFDFNVSFWVNVSLGGDGPVKGINLLEKGLLVAKMKDNQLNASLQLALYEDKLRSIQDNQIADLSCLLDLVGDADLLHAWFNTTPAEIGLFALSDGSAERDIDEAVDNILRLFVTSFNSAIPALFNGLLEGPGRALINEMIGTELSATQRKPCPAGEAVANDMGLNYSALMVAAIILSCVYALVAAFAVRFSPPMAGSSKSPEEKPLTADKKTGYSVIGDENPTRPWWQESLICSPKLPLYVRLGVPALVLGNVLLFITGNTAVGASVFLLLDIDRQIQLPSLFDFSLGNTVTDMWKSGVYPLAIMVALFSGGWPYLKLLIMLVSWMTPERIMSAHLRERVVMTLDALGKFSLMDAYVMTLMIVAFRFSIDSPPTNDEDGGVVSIDVVVNPRGGFYVFLLATMVSLVASHAITFYHRKSMTTEELVNGQRLVESTKTRAEPLCMHAFRVGSMRVQMTRRGKWLVAGVLLGALILVFAGLDINSFIFHFKGAAALALDFLGSAVERPFSIWSLGMAIPGSTLFAYGIGGYTIQLSYLFFAMFFPLLHIIVMLILWLVPMRASVQRRVYLVTEILNAWSALEVFVLSLVGALTEIEQFAGFLVGPHCDAINPYIAKYLDGPLHGHDVCFSVSATLDDGCWILFSACVGYLSAGWFVMLLCHKVMEERDAQYKKVGHAAAHPPRLLPGQAVVPAATLDGGEWGVYVDPKADGDENKLGWCGQKCTDAAVYVGLIMILENTSVAAQTN